MPNHKILIVEDDTSYGVMLQGWIKKKGYDAVLCFTVEQAKKEILKTNFNLIITDLRLPNGDGIMLLTWVKDIKKNIPVIIMTSYAEIQSAVSAMKLGAFDYLEKPVNPSLLEQKINQALTYIPAKPVPSQKEKRPSMDIVYGKSPAAKQLFEHIDIIAPTNMSVLITGESGTGKEYAARLIHEKSLRKEAPFIALDCGSLSRELAPSELFGHLKGSFTSAVTDKKGVFEQAQGGTVFLDEIGNLSYEVQVQLLRALQELRIRPVGSATDIQVDIRMIAATNEDFGSAIATGKFREDLYYRLAEIPLTIPPLRERIHDLPTFVDYFIEKANVELDKEVKGITNEAISVLKQYKWNGNLRELRNVIRRTVLFTKTDRIEVENLPSFLSTSVEKEDVTIHTGNEETRIKAALEKTKGNKAAAARLLNIDRKTLYNKLELYNLKD